MNASEFQALTGATPAQMADLETFITRLTEVNAVMNLIGPDTLPDVWNRHFWDSAQLLALCIALARGLAEFISLQRCRLLRRAPR